MASTGWGPKPYEVAPVASCTAAVAGEWSGWVWVMSRWVTRWPSTASRRAATWSSSAGPGSMMATFPFGFAPGAGPMMNVPDPW